MTAQFRILFAGSILEGFELETVKIAAADKLKASPAQVDRLFSGKRSVLKKNLADDKARQYMRALQKIGMDVSLEEEESAELELAPIQLDLMASAASAPVDGAAAANYDPEKTLLSNPALAAGLLDVPPAEARASLEDLPSLDPDPAVPFQAASSHEATMIVPPTAAMAVIEQMKPATSAADEATLIVSPSDAARMIAQQAGSAASQEATLIVSQADVAAMLKSQQGAASSSHEETLIVSPAKVKEFVAEQKAAAAAAPQPVPPSQNQKPSTRNEGGSNTVLYFGAFLVLLVSAIAFYLFW